MTKSRILAGKPASFSLDSQRGSGITINKNTSWIWKPISYMYKNYDFIMGYNSIVHLNAQHYIKIDKLDSRHNLNQMPVGSGTEFFKKI